MLEFKHSSGKFFDAGDAKIYYEEIGGAGASTIVMLHGGFGNLQDLNSLLPQLTKGYRIVGIDSRGQGKSTLGTKKLTYEQIQLDVESLLKYLNISEADIFGFSDGGVVGYRIAARNVIKVNRLITVGANGSSDDLNQTRELFERITPDGWKQKFPATHETYLKLNPEPDFYKLTMAMKELWLDESTSGYPNKEVSKITCRTLIVRGDNDHLFPRKSAAELADQISNSMLYNLPFAGHESFADQPELFQLVIEQFLKN